MKRHKLLADCLVPYIVMALSWSWYMADTGRIYNLFS